MVSSALEPDSEPSFESAEEGLIEEFRGLQLVPVTQAESRARPDQSSSSTEHPESSSSEVPALTTTFLPATSLEPGLRQVTRQEPERFYAVWGVPRYQGTLNLVGIHSGPGLTAYSGLLACNQGEFKGLRFRRADTLRAAITLFLSEADRHGVDRTLAHNRVRWQ